MAINSVLKYKRKMGKYTILLVVIGIISALTMLSFHLNIPGWAVLILFVVFFISIFGGAFTLGFYVNGKRYLHLLNALGSDVIDARIIKGALKCKSVTYGDFYADYIVKGNYGANNYHRLWITTYKRFPVSDYKIHNGIWDTTFVKEGDMIKKLLIYIKRGENTIIELPEGIPLEGVEGNKSFSEVTLWTRHGEKRIMAKFNDLWPYKETQDMISFLDILKKIEEKL